MASSPLIIVPTTTSATAVLVPVKARPGNDGACGQGRATADLDRPCARRPQHVWVGAKKPRRRHQVIRFGEQWCYKLPPGPFSVWVLRGPYGAEKRVRIRT